MNDFDIYMMDAKRMLKAVKELAKPIKDDRLAKRIQVASVMLKHAKSDLQLDLTCCHLRGLFADLNHKEVDRNEDVFDTPQSSRAAGIRRSNEMRRHGNGERPEPVVDYPDEWTQSLSVSGVEPRRDRQEIQDISGPRQDADGLARPLPKKKRRSYNTGSKLRRSVRRSDS